MRKLGRVEDSSRSLDLEVVRRFAARLALVVLDQSGALAHRVVRVQVADRLRGVHGRPAVALDLVLPHRTAGGAVVLHLAVLQ